MKGHLKNPTMIVVLFLLLQSHLTVSEEQVQQYVIGEKDLYITLQCFDQPVNATSALYRWKKDGNVTTQSEHLFVSNNGSLRISGLQFIDEGLYECESQNDTGSKWQTLSNIQLKIADGPTSVLLSMQPVSQLQNGTFFVQKGSDVHLICSSQSYPSQNLTLTVEDLALDNRERAVGTNSPLEFIIRNIQPSDQGTYTCTSKNSLSMTTVNRSQDLLVYYAPERHPECSWEVGNDSSTVLFICTWYGGYPLPILEWHDVLGKSVTSRTMITSMPHTTEYLKVSVNRSRLRNDEQVMCTGKHAATGVTNSCSFTLKMPYPSGEPLVTALVGSNITLICTETQSLPPAKTVWKKKTDLIYNTSKYFVSNVGPTFKLTIVNVSKDDEGLYICYSENPLGARELELWLTVKTSAENGGIAVGIFVSILIIMSGIIVGVTLYTKRDRICIGLGFTHLDDEIGDVLSLVDSDEEEIFNEAVPRLPPLTNGNATTLVEIHRIPSSDHEDNADSAEHTDQNQTEPVKHTVNTDC